MCFIRDIKKIIAKLPPRKQTLFFSATMPQEIETIARKYLKDPAVEKLAGQDIIPSEIHHHVVRVSQDTRLSVLLHLLKQEEPETAIVFTRMKHETKRLAKKLEDHAGIKAGYLNGNMSQNARNTMLARFREGDISVLVATDVAARGLDIEGLSHVFHYAVPTVVETYIHRSGRTGRAGNSGKTYTLVAPDGEGDFKQIQKKIKFTELTLDDMVRVEDTPAPPPPPRQGRGQRPQAAPRTNATPQGQAPSRHLAAPQGRNDGRNEAPRGRRPVGDAPATIPSNSAWRKFKMALAPGHRHNDEGFQGWLADYVGVKRNTIRAVRVGNDHATFELDGIAAERFLVKVNDRGAAPRR
jgi:superfamily II DNA/RNA helicase